MPIRTSDRDMLPMAQDSFDAYPTALIGTRYPLAQGLAQMEIVTPGRHGNGLRCNAMGAYLDEFLDPTQSNYPGYVPCLYPDVVNYHHNEFAYVSVNLFVPAFAAGQEITLLQWSGTAYLTGPSRLEHRVICSLVLQGDGTIRFDGADVRASRPGAFPFGQWSQLQWWFRTDYWRTAPYGSAREVPMAVRVEKAVGGGGGATIASHQTVLGPDGVPGNFCRVSLVPEEFVLPDELRVGMIAGTATGTTVTIDDLVIGTLSAAYHNAHILPPLLSERTGDNAWMRAGKWHDGLWVENLSLTGDSTLEPYPYGIGWDIPPQTLPWVRQGDTEDFRCVDEQPAHDADATMLSSAAPLDSNNDAYFDITGFRHAPITHTITGRTEDVFAMTCNLWDSRTDGGTLHWWCETAGLQWQNHPNFDADLRPAFQGINSYTSWDYTPGQPYSMTTRAIKLYPAYGCHIGIQWGPQWPWDVNDPEYSAAGIGQSMVYTEEEVNATQFWIAANGPFPAHPSRKTYVSQVSCEVSHAPRWDLVTHTLKPSYCLGTESLGAFENDIKHTFMRRGLEIDTPFYDHHLCVTGYRHDGPDRIQDDVKFLWHVPAGAPNPDFHQGDPYPSPPLTVYHVADESLPGEHTTVFWWQHPRQEALGTPPVLRLFARAKKEGPGPTTLSIIYRKNGDLWPADATRVLGTHTLTTEYEYYDLVIPVEPDSGASWTEDALRNAQFGIKGEATGENVRVSALYIEATWEEPPWEPATPWAGWTEAYPADVYPPVNPNEQPKVLAVWFLDSFGQTPTGHYGGAEQYWGNDGRNWAGHAMDWYDGLPVGETRYPMVVNPDDPSTVVPSTNFRYLNNLVPSFKWPGKYGDVQAEFPGRDGRDGCVKMKGHWSGICHAYEGQIQNVGGFFYTGQIGFAFKTQPKGDWDSEETHVRLLGIYFQWDILWSMYEALQVTLDVRRDGHLVVNRRGGPMKDLAGAHCVSTIPLPALDEWNYIEIRFHVGPATVLDTVYDVDDSSRPGEINLRINGQDAGNFKDIHTCLDARFNRSGDRSGMGWWHHEDSAGGVYGEGPDYIMLGGDVRNPGDPHDLTTWFDDYYEASVTYDYWYEEFPPAQFLGQGAVQLLNQTGPGEHYYGEGFMADYLVGDEGVRQVTDDKPLHDSGATAVTGAPIYPPASPPPPDQRHRYIPVTLDPVTDRVLAWQPMAVHRNDMQPFHDWYWGLPGATLDEVLGLSDEFGVLSGRDYGNNDPWPGFTYTGFEMYDGWCMSYNPFHPYTDDPDPVTGLYGGKPGYSAEEFNDFQWGHHLRARATPSPPPWPQYNPIEFTQMCVEVLTVRKPPEQPVYIFSQVVG